MNDGSINHRALLMNARRLVIKVGTGVVCNNANEFDPLQTAALAGSIARLGKEGRQVVLVSSGAVTLGAAELGIHRSRLKDASVTRACAAVGQCKLMQAYAESFRPHGIKVAQVLVTEDDFSDLKRYSILRQTFERLLKLGAVPIVNENDTVTNIYTEQAPVFRDNDRLAALVLSKLDADALVLLSNVDGLLYSPNQDLTNATVVTMVTEITAAIRESARGTSATGFHRVSDRPDLLLAEPSLFQQHVRGRLDVLDLVGEVHAGDLTSPLAAFVAVLVDARDDRAAEVELIGVAAA